MLRPPSPPPATVTAALRPPRVRSVPGTGMSCLGFKGGIGSASRLVGDGFTVGVLVMTNFGERERLTVAGVPVGTLLPAEPRAATARAGRELHRDRRSPTRRSWRPTVRGWRGGPVSGLARTGSTGHHGSGEIFVAAATGLRVRAWCHTDPSVRSPDAGSTRSSRPWSRRPRRPCSTACSRRPLCTVEAATSHPGCPPPTRNAQLLDGPTGGRGHRRVDRSIPRRNRRTISGRPGEEASAERGRGGA